MGSYRQDSNYLMRSVFLFIWAILAPFFPKIFFTVTTTLPTMVLNRASGPTVPLDPIPGINTLFEFLTPASYVVSVICFLFSIFFIFRYFSTINLPTLKSVPDDTISPIQTKDKDEMLSPAILDSTFIQGLNLDVSSLTKYVKDKWTIAVEEKSDILKSKFSSISNLLDNTNEKHFNCSLIFNEKLPLMLKSYQSMPESFRSDPIHFDEIMKQLSLIELLLQDTINDISDMKKVEAKNVTKYFENKIQEI